MHCMRKSYELKRLRTLGDEEADDKEVHFLNRLIRVGTYHNQPAVFLEPDRRDVGLLIRNLGLEQAKGVDTLDVKKSVDQQMLESMGPILGKELSVKYGSSVMRAAYLSQDRPISHAVKNLSRKMVNPTEASLGDLKRLGRYLKMFPDFSQMFSRQKMPSKLVVQVDSDHAGCAVTRRSTTGMIALFGGHALKLETRKQCAKHNRPKHRRVRILRFSERRLDSLRHAKPAIRPWNRTSNCGRIGF